MTIASTMMESISPILFACKISIDECRILGKTGFDEDAFRKYAGRTLADLPGNYLAWFAREGFPKSELGQLLELMHTLDHNGLRGLLTPIQRAHGLAAKSKLL